MLFIAIKIPKLLMFREREEERERGREKGINNTPITCNQSFVTGHCRTRVNGATYQLQHR